VESDISIWANGDFSIWRLHPAVARQMLWNGRPLCPQQRTYPPPLGTSASCPEAAIVPCRWWRRL